MYVHLFIFIFFRPSFMSPHTPHSSFGCHMISGDKSSLKTKEEWLLSWDVVCGCVFLFLFCTLQLFFLILTFSLESFFETNKIFWCWIIFCCERMDIRKEEDRQKQWRTMVLVYRLVCMKERAAYVKSILLCNVNFFVIYFYAGNNMSLNITSGFFVATLKTTRKIHKIKSKP